MKTMNRSFHHHEQLNSGAQLRSSSSQQHSSKAWGWSSLIFVPHKWKACPFIQQSSFVACDKPSIAAKLNYTIAERKRNLGFRSLQHGDGDGSHSRDTLGHSTCSIGKILCTRPSYRGARRGGSVHPAEASAAAAGVCGHPRGVHQGRAEESETGAAEGAGGGEADSVGAARHRAVH